MTLTSDPFLSDFKPGTIHFGRGCVEDISSTLSDSGLAKTLVVTGRNVGANPGVMGPIESGVGDHLVGVFDETTPAKLIGTVYDGVDRMRELDVDCIVAVGSGSSLDTATMMSVLHGEYHSLSNLREVVEETGQLPLPQNPDDLTPLIVVPTTFAGADLTGTAGVNFPGNGGMELRGIVGSQALMPEALFYDPNLFETTPMGVLTGSAMNGFDKGIETIYSRYSTPITDATAVRALKYLRSSLPKLRESDEPSIMDRAVTGIILAQYGWASPGRYKLNVIHAFGHGLRNQWGIQQGVAHAIIAPLVLELIFNQVDGRRDLLAQGLVVEDAINDTAAAVVDAVRSVRDSLGVPTRLADIDGTSKEGIGGAVKRIYEDDFIRIGPPGFDPTPEQIEEVLRDAW